MYLKKKGGKVELKEKLGAKLKVSRGPHIEKSEKNMDDLSNPNISEAYIVSYEDVEDYKYNFNTTLAVRYDDNRKVFVDFNKKHKKNQVKSQDIIISCQSIFNRPRLIIFDEDVENNKYIYDNSAIYLRKISDDVDMRFIYHLMTTNKIRNKINEVYKNNEKRKITCEKIANILIDFPSLAEQQRIVKELEYMRGNLEDLIG